MANWITYLKERFPLPVYFILVGGISCSGSLMATGEFSLKGTLLSFLGILWWFGVLRLMDELKDFEKDKVVHPERPLPRGILTPGQVSRAINGLMLLGIAYAVIVALLSSVLAGVLFLITAVWLWGMYKEFYLGEWLQNRPILYAISHELVLLIICAFAVVVHDSSQISSPSTWWYGVAVFGSFFSYEVCRKLDPQADPLLKTYLYVYGTQKTHLLVTVLNVIAALGAANLALKTWLWPFEALTVLAFILMYKASSKYKLVELAATISLLIHIWGVSLAYVTIFLGLGG